jgi:hypothetical protein
MNERRYVGGDYIKRMALGAIALQLVDDCYKEKPSKESISYFLTKISQLRDKASNRC